MDIQNSYLSLIGSVALFALSACSSNTATNDSKESVESDTDGQTVTVDTNLKQIISDRSLTGNPMTGRTIPDISSNEAQLGMRLFYSKALGGDWDSACASCHHPTLGGGDNLSLPIGVGATSANLLGPGRAHDSSSPHSDGGPPVPRNAPTTFNLAAWDSVMFHDGRVESIGKTAGENGDDGQGIRTPDTAFGAIDPLAGQNLAQAQARFPVTSPEEMKGFENDGLNNQELRDYLSSRLGNYGEGSGELYNTAYWLEQFRTALNKPEGSAQELITEQQISFLIGEYERSQSFIETPWKRYIEGDDTALSEKAKNGALIFFNPVADGGANCSSCHSGDFFTDEKFHNVAMPQLGRGKGDGDDTSEDFGRFRETKADDDKFAFRTPSLLNVEVTGPWSHAGAYTSLEAVVRHNLDPEAAISSYDSSQLTQAGIQNLDKIPSNTQKALDKLQADRAAGKSVIEKVSLTDEQVSDLIEFLKALTDPCVKDRSCLAKWIVGPNNPDPSGDQLDAVNENGALL